MGALYDFKKDVLQESKPKVRVRDSEARLNYLEQNLVIMMAYLNALVGLVLEKTDISIEEFQGRAKTFLDATKGVRGPNED